MLISVSFWKSMWRSSEKGNLKGDGLTRGGVYVLGPQGEELFTFRESTIGLDPTMEAVKSGTDLIA